MTRQAELIQEIDKLPSRYIGEVIDFVGYLRQKAKNDAAVEIAADTEAFDPVKGREAIEKCSGLFKRMGINLSSDEFLEMRWKDKELEDRLAPAL